VFVVTQGMLSSKLVTQGYGQQVASPSGFVGPAGITAAEYHRIRENYERQRKRKRREEEEAALTLIDW
jgi:hypothetical protein